MKLSFKEESMICLSCGECCKRYSITILPEEIPKIAKLLKISKKKFLQEYCELFVKIYPKSVPGLLTFATTFFPKKIGELISTILSYPPTGFLIVPQIALKRVSGVCVFLQKNNSCKIYSKRPSPCKLFPFMVVPGYEEQYPFCELFRKQSHYDLKHSKIFSKKISNYFKIVDKKGFEKVWFNPPEKGKLFLNELLLGKINLNQLNKMFSHKIK